MGQYVLSLSYGKDSLACLKAISVLGLPLDRIITADMWATDTLKAEHPSIASFKEYADREILKRYGIRVEHFCAMKDGKKYTFEDHFYSLRRSGNYAGRIIGWPMVQGCEVLKALKLAALRQAELSKKDGDITYIGYAANEIKRAQKMVGKNQEAPLILAGMDEDFCTMWCRKKHLLNPTYSLGGYRDGCFFCPQQNIDSLRRLRHTCPDRWAWMMRLDDDSPVHFHPDGHTLHDYDKRFEMEDRGLWDKDDKRFRWKWIVEVKEER